jgi:predicted DNA-binding transcriptional regulator AlpA
MTREEQAQRQLQRYVRFKHLVEAGVVGNWPTLLRFIESEGFPPGIMIGPNTRAWPLDEVETWLANRPTAGPSHLKPHASPCRPRTDQSISPVTELPQRLDTVAVETKGTPRPQGVQLQEPPPPGASGRSH